MEWLLLDVEEDALAWAFLSGFNHSLESVFGNTGHALSTSRIVGTVELLFSSEVRSVFFDVIEAVIHSKEDIRSDLGAQAIARAKILVDPDFDHTATPFLAVSELPYRQTHDRNDCVDKIRMNFACAQRPEV